MTDNKLFYINKIKDNNIKYKNGISFYYFYPDDKSIQLTLFYILENGEKEENTSTLCLQEYLIPISQYKWEIKNSK